MTTTELKNKKITFATLKAFIRKSNVLYAEVKSSFNGMTDCVEHDFDSNLQQVSKEQAIGVNGVWCVGSSRDYFAFVENETHYGIEVSNSCGCGILWTNK